MEAMGGGAGGDIVALYRGGVVEEKRICTGMHGTACLFSVFHT